MLALLANYIFFLALAPQSQICACFATQNRDPFARMRNRDSPFFAYHDANLRQFAKNLRLTDWRTKSLLLGFVPFAFGTPVYPQAGKIIAGREKNEVIERKEHKMLDDIFASRGVHSCRLQIQSPDHCRV